MYTISNVRIGLPKPKIAHIQQLHTASQQQKAATAEVPTPSPSKQPKAAQASYSSDPVSDPWASPSNKRAPPPSAAAHSTPNGSFSQPDIRANGMARTTSDFTTTSAQDDSSGHSPSDTRPTNALNNAWGSYNGSSGGFSEQPTLGGGFGDAGDDGGAAQPTRIQPSVGSVVLPSGTGESVTVTLLPEKEGMFLFQHHNYEVKTNRRGSSVVRRYSDFVWLLDCLQKRYPFRRLPLLPPKRVQVNGTHLAGDVSNFLEKRRKGLVRFANQLVQHPVLSQETLVVMFCTVPTVSAISILRLHMADDD